MEAHSPRVDVLKELRSGRQDSLDRLMPVVYDHLRVIASRQLEMREGGGTLSTTGLVHEAYLKLVDQSRVAWRDRSHFFALASVAMRHVLVDRARARLAQKREGGFRRVTLDDEQLDANDQAALMVDLNDAIDRLAVTEPRLARVVECRFFGGLSEEETAEVLEVNTRTVQRDWAKARMLLRRALSL
jgi:RNA polymerase sigma factor (TIGR02999 family)